MKHAWKTLGSVIVAAALVAAPLSMASAEETPPPDAVVEPAVTEEVIVVSPDAVDEAAVEVPAEQPVAETNSNPYPSPSPTETWTPDPPKPCSDEASKGGYHHDCVPQPPGFPSLTSECSGPGVATVVEFWTDFVWNDDTHEWVAGEPVQVGSHEAPDAGCIIVVHPPRPTWVDECGPDNGHWVYEDVAGNGYKYYEYTDNDGRHWITVLPEKVGDGYVIAPSDLFLLHETETNVDPCIVPLPVQFAAEPTPPTCDTDGALPNLADPAAIVVGDGNVDLSFDRPYDGPGTYTLTATALNGFVFEDGSTVKTRDITVDGALGFQSTDSEAPCYITPQVVIPQPQTPSFYDLCGIDDDSYTVPGDTADVVYTVVEDGDTVTITASLVNEDDEFAEGTVTEWSFTFTDEACSTPTPTPTPTPSSTSPALAATGGGDVSPLLPMGASVLIVAGAVLMVMRRFARN